MSRKVFCGASNPFMTGMARGASWRRGAEGGQLGRAPGGALPAGPGRPMRGPASYPPSHRRRLCSKPLGFRLGGSFPHGPASFPRARPRPPRGPARGGATRDTRTSLRGPPSRGERPTRVSLGENSRHASREQRLEEAARSRRVRHASSRWPRPRAWGPGARRGSAPRVSPGAAPAGKGAWLAVLPAGAALLCSTRRSLRAARRQQGLQGPCAPPCAQGTLANSASRPGRMDEKSSGGPSGRVLALPFTECVTWPL